MGRKLTPAEIDRFKQLLMGLKNELSGDIDRLEADAFGHDNEKVSMDNLADIGSDSFAQEFSLELLQRDEATLAEIGDALSRLRDGTFGQCESCAQWLGKARLSAVPYARFCIDCQRLEESGAR